MLISHRPISWSVDLREWVRRHCYKLTERPRLIKDFSSSISGFQGHLNINIQPSHGGKGKVHMQEVFMDQAWRLHTFHWLELKSCSDT